MSVDIFEDLWFSSNQWKPILKKLLGTVEIYICGFLVKFCPFLPSSLLLSGNMFQMSWLPGYKDHIQLFRAIEVKVVQSLLCLYFPFGI